MKNLILIIAILIISLQTCKITNTPTIQLVVGTYTNEKSEGIYTLDFNPENGTLSNQRLLYQIDDPTFQQYDQENKALYTIGKRKGINYLISFIQNNDQGFVIHDSIKTNQNGICHVNYNNKLKIVVASNYSSGSITQANLNYEFNFENVKTEKHYGNSINSFRQEAPHAHSVTFNENLAYACDLGADKIYIYRPKNKWLQKIDSIATQAGSGPRHLTFSPDGKSMVVLNELASSITLFQKNKNNLFTQPIQTISTLPDTLTQFSKAADIHYSPNGEFIYASNRGFNSIAVFKQTQSNIELVEIETEGCNWIRNFAISPNGKFLIAANRYGNNINVYSIDQKTGALKLSDKSIEINQPVCITVVY